MIIIPVATNSFIFLIYDSYLKKSPDKLNDHEKILYEKFFENDLDADTTITKLYVSYTNSNNESFCEDDKEKPRKNSNNELNFSKTFLNKKNDNVKDKTLNKSSLDNILTEEDIKEEKDETQDTDKPTSSERSSRLGVSEDLGEK